jgi:hypothetical protein
MSILLIGTGGNQENRIEASGPIQFKKPDGQTFSCPYALARNTRSYSVGVYDWKYVHSADFGFMDITNSVALSWGNVREITITKPGGYETREFGIGYSHHIVLAYNVSGCLASGADYAHMDIITGRECGTSPGGFGKGPAFPDGGQIDIAFVDANRMKITVYYPVIANLERVLLLGLWRRTIV